MSRDQIFDEYSKIIEANKVSKFEELVNFLNRGLGETIYADLKNVKHDFFDVLRTLSWKYPRETFYVWQQFYNYLTRKELNDHDRIELATSELVNEDATLSLNI